VVPQLGLAQSASYFEIVGVLVFSIGISAVIYQYVRRKRPWVDRKIRQVPKEFYDSGSSMPS
jgi:hypothetical protein